tara:strand:- start:334 stop:768 length:435 start_codon:yes stop_codon:yes gene_type:complete
MNLNENTRPIYDELSTHNRSIITEMPMKYMTKQLTDERQLVETTPENIDTGTTLRMQPTRLNDFYNNNTVLMGTAPYRFLGQSPFVDTDSFLRNKELNEYSNRTLTELQFNNQDYITGDIAIDFRPNSTRTQLRNSYCKNKIKV